jgi:hypothetical protein
MAQDSWPSPTHNARAVTDSEYERISVRYSGDGVYGDPTDSANIVAGTGLQVTVKSERSGNVRGFNWYSGTSDTTLSISSNTSGSTRIDRVVLRLDRSTWDVRAVVRTGTPGAGAPALQQDTGTTGLYEIPLAQVTVINNATSVTVAREELYVGHRIRPCTSTTRPLSPRRGEIGYETDTGKWIGWNGTSWVVLRYDTGQLTISAGYSVWTQPNANIGRRQGDQVWLRVWVQRNTSTFQASDSDGSKIGVLPSALIPSYNQYFAAKFSGSGGNARVEVRTDGEIWVTENDSDVPVGGSLQLTMTYAV